MPTVTEVIALREGLANIQPRPGETPDGLAKRGAEFQRQFLYTPFTWERLSDAQRRAWLEWASNKLAAEVEYQSWLVRDLHQQGVVIVHPKWGIYIGNLFGLGFWSKLDPVGQPGAVVFPGEQAARAHMASWEHQPSGCTFVPVRPNNDGYASIAACVAAGLDGW